MEALQLQRIGWRVRVVRSGLIAVFVLAAFVGALSTTERDPVKVARQPEMWVANHTGSLPLTLAELAAYPPRYRQAIFRTLSRERRLEMVHQHLRDLLATRIGEFSVEQRSYLESLADRTWAALLAKDPLAVPARLAAAECEAQKALFPVKTLRAEVGDRHIGDYTNPIYSVQAALVWASESVQRTAVSILPVSLSARGEELTCNCNRDNSVCDCPQTVCQNKACTNPGQPICQEAWIGCIFTNPVTCNGWCGGGEEDGPRRNR
jgi:hypothetical protein